MGNVNAAAAAAVPEPPPECPMHAAEKNKNKARETYKASAAEAKECPVKDGQDPAAATQASQVRSLPARFCSAADPAFKAHR